MPPDPQASTVADLAKDTIKPTPELAVSDNGHADRAAFLALVGDLAEETVTLTTSAGKELHVLVRELTGEERADLITLQAEAYQRGSLEMRKYEQKLLMAGVADPTSPKGARMPLLKGGDADLLMKLGASKTRRMVEKIEELSGMGAAAQKSVEGNSVTIPSVVSTSG